jgi:O-succinylbenzoic acid--CoA ligase
MTLCYENKYYSWQDINAEITCCCKASKKQPKHFLMVRSQDVFLTSMSLLAGFTTKQLVFPTCSDVFYKTISFNQNEQQLALAIATSGTQSEPKIALLSRNNIIAHCQSFNKIIPTQKTSIWLNCLPLNHIAGVMIVYRCWFNQASLLLHKGFNADKVWHDIQFFSVSHVSLVPRMLYRLLESAHGNKPPETLQYVLVGGDKLPTDLHQRALSLGWPIYISYGMTEATSSIAIGKTTDCLTVLEGLCFELEPNQVLKIKGDMLFSHYYNAAERAVSDWFITQDKVYVQGQCLRVMARNSQMIISGGESIAPEFIESLFSLDGCFVRDIAIGHYSDSDFSPVSKDKQYWGDTIVAVFCGEISYLASWITENIAKAYRPRLLLSIKSIPRNGMGKIDRRALQTIINDEINRAVSLELLSVD